MPCRDDRDSPQEINRARRVQQLRHYLNELIAQVSSVKRVMVKEQNNATIGYLLAHHNGLTADMLAQMLCAALTYAESVSVNLDFTKSIAETSLHVWWVRHKEADAQRVKEKRAKLKAIEAELAALKAEISDEGG